MIRSVLKDLESLYGVVCAEKGDVTQKYEIDLVAEYAHEADIVARLTESGFAVGPKKNHKRAAWKCIDGHIYMFDIAFHVQYLATLFPTITLTDALHARVREDGELLDFLQAVFLLRGSKKHVQRIRDGYDRYVKYLRDTTYVYPVPFRDERTKEHLVAMAERRPFALVRSMYVRHAGARYVAAIRKRMQWHRGECVSIVGVDGAGKSTVVEKLSTLPRTRIVYMGDGQFLCTPLYVALKRIGRIGRYVSYVLQYVEMWLRYGYICVLTLRGLRVITDRYPGFNRHLVLHREWYRPSNFLFALIPKPDRFIFISAPASVIHERKQELSMEEIDVYQSAIRTKITESDRGVEIENVDLDATINTVLTYIR